MKPRLLIFLLFTVIALPLVADREVRDGVVATSLVRVVAHPEEYNGKRILLKGFLRRGFEESGLYFSRDDAAILNTRQALWVGSVKGGREDIEFPDEGWVMIVGKFSYDQGKGSGHMNLWLAEIADIEQIQVLSADRLAAEVEPVVDWAGIDAADVFRRWPADRRTQEGQIIWLDDLGREFARLNLKDNKPYAGIEFVAGASDFRSVRVYAEGKVIRHIGFARPGGQEEWELFYDEP